MKSVVWIGLRYVSKEGGGQPECFVTQLTDGPKTGGELISGILQYIGLAFKTNTRDNEHISLIPWHFVLFNYYYNDWISQTHQNSSPQQKKNFLNWKMGTVACTKRQNHFQQDC